MTDWSALTHAYGSADDLPAMLQSLGPGANEGWSELWSRVCHQGSVYPASAAVMPHLLEMAERWPGAERFSPIHLAGAIVASQDVADGCDFRPYRHDIERLAALGLDTLVACKLPREEFIYLLQATLALEGDMVWGRQLEGLVDGEFVGDCPTCCTPLQIVIGDHGFFVTDDEWVNRPDQPRRAIVACDATALPAVGARLHRIAREAGRPEVAHSLTHVFGRSTCPACHGALSITAAIANVED